MTTQFFLVCLVSATAFWQGTSNQTSPATMTKLVVRLESPDVSEKSFPALPKTMFRADTRYCRIEELPDTEHGIHGLVVINEPDIWLANRLDKTAQHRVDPGPTFNCRLPIFVDGDDAKSADKNNPLTELEFGRELAFFKARGAKSTSGPALQGKATNAYSVEIGDSQLLLFTSATPERPVAVVRQRKTKREVYWYDVHEEVPFDAKFFARPEGVKIEDTK
jgi:hypothetical protein